MAVNKVIKVLAQRDDALQEQILSLGKYKIRVAKVSFEDLESGRSRRDG